MSNFNSLANERGVRNKHLVAVWYTGSQWSILNQDMGFMPQEAAFNVQIFSEGDSAFIHTDSHICEYYEELDSDRSSSRI